jgi:hypothetical protein
MTRSKRIHVGTFLLVLSFLWSSLGFAEKSTIKKEDVPEAVMKAFSHAYPFAKATGFSKEDRDGTILYGIGGSIGKVKLEMVYTEAGDLFMVEETVVMKLVPKALLKAIQKSHPKMKITKAEKLTRGDETLYELYLAKGKEKSQVELDLQGNIVYPKPEEKPTEQTPPPLQPTEAPADPSKAPETPK